MNRESGMETYTLPYVNMQWESALCYRELSPLLCDNLEGWDGWEVGGRINREGTWVYLW